MLHIIHQVLDAGFLENVRKELATGEFRDGRETAFGMARNVKNNLQLDWSKHPALLDQFRAVLIAHAELRRLAMPLQMSKLRLARYETGMEYGAHSDNPTIEAVRADISFTLFLSDPDSYSGGELAIESALGDMLIRLPAGSMVLYDTSATHRVTPVTRGRREVLVGWIQSQIRDHRRREIVSDLEKMRKEYLARVGHDSHADLLLKCSNNLQRMWIEK